MENGRLEARDSGRSGPESRSAPKPRSQAPSPISSPADRLALVLLVEPRLERREVVRHRGRIHLTLTGERLERVLPWARRTHLEHLLQPPAGFLAVVDRAAIQRRFAAGRLRERTVELELQDARKKVP